MFDLWFFFKHYLRMNDKKSNRGGKRPNAGRKKLGNYPMKRVLIPEPMIDAVIDAREEFLNMPRVTSHYPTQAMFPALHNISISAPLFSSSVPAGFASPADDHTEKELDLNDHFVTSPSSTFYVRVAGDSMNMAGIFDNTILQVDKSLEVRHQDIVVATVEGEFTVKRFIKRNGHIYLMPESTNQIHRPYSVSQMKDISIWGVVSGIHQKLR